MEQSILKSTKKILGIGPDDTSFDLDIITHINSAFSVLHDLGVGPEEGFVIEDDTVEWDAFLADDPVKMGKIKTAVWLRTRLLFDPPTSGFLLDSTKEQLREQEWRLVTDREATEWTDPEPSVPPVLVGDEGELIPPPSYDFDGGPA
jgi:hypothetical protein